MTDNDTSIRWEVKVSESEALWISRIEDDTVVEAMNLPLTRHEVPFAKAFAAALAKAEQRAADLTEMLREVMDLGPHLSPANLRRMHGKIRRLITQPALTTNPSEVEE